MLSHSNTIKILTCVALCFVWKTSSQDHTQACLDKGGGENKTQTRCQGEFNHDDPEQFPPLTSVSMEHLTNCWEATAMWGRWTAARQQPHSRTSINESDNLINHCMSKHPAQLKKSIKYSREREWGEKGLSNSCNNVKKILYLNYHNVGWICGKSAVSVW